MHGEGIRQSSFRGVPGLDKRMARYNRFDVTDLATICPRSVYMPRRS